MHAREDDDPQLDAQLVLRVRPPVKDSLREEDTVQPTHTAAISGQRSAYARSVRSINAWGRGRGDVQDSSAHAEQQRPSERAREVVDGHLEIEVDAGSSGEETCVRERGRGRAYISHYRIT